MIPPARKQLLPDPYLAAFFPQGESYPAESFLQLLVNHRQLKLRSPNLTELFSTAKTSS